MADPLDLLIGMRQRRGEFKAEFLQATLLGNVVDVRIHLHLPDIEPIKEKKDEILLDFGPIAFASFLREGNLNSNHRSAWILGTNPVMDGANGRPVAQFDQEGLLPLIPELPACTCSRR